MTGLQAPAGVVTRVFGGSTKVTAESFGPQTPPWGVSKASVFWESVEEVAEHLVLKKSV